MARTFRRQRHMHPVAELNVTNLVDLGFTLLIIFMIATPMMEQEQRIPLDLPIESSKPQNNEKEVFQTVSIDKNGIYYWGDQRSTLDQIRTQLNALSAKPKPPVVRIRADFTLQYQRVVSLLDAVKSSGLSRISLDTQSDK